MAPMGDARRAIPIAGGAGLGSRVPTLTERQTKIVEMIAAGYTDKQLAGRLGMSPGTLRTHLDRMFRRFGVHTRAALVARWLRGF
jgi:DNA-binding CsgD family transcriptional regulator